MHIHFIEPLEDEAARLIAEKVDSSVRVTSGEVGPEASDYDILVAGVPERKHIETSKQLKAVVIPWAGLPVKTRDLMLQFPDIAVYNIHHNAAPTAESALTLMLAAARDLVDTDRKLRIGDWTPRYESDRPLLMENRTALILGYGAVGRRVGKACYGLGMEVHAVKTTVPKPSRGIIKLHTPDELPSLLPVANVLFLCLPRTPETDGLIGAAQLASLPDDAIIVNVSRGAIIDEEALYEELRSGRLRAGLDVWYMYPRDEASRDDQRPSEYPFGELTNVVMTPHMAGHCAGIEALRAMALSDLINSLVRDDGLIPEQVDVERGY